MRVATNTGVAAPAALHLQAFSASWCFVPPASLRPCFMPLTPLGFVGDLQSLPPIGSQVALSRALPSLPSPLADASRSTSRVQTSAGSVHRGSVLPEVREPVLSWPSSPPRCVLGSLGPGISARASSRGLGTTLGGHPPIVMPALQSFKEPPSEPCSFEPDVPP